MKKVKLMMMTLMMLSFLGVVSCSKSPTDKAHSSVKSYLKDNLKDNVNYEPISFTQLDTLKTPDTTDTKLISVYKITHNYSIVNSDKDKVKMTVLFYLDKDLKVTETNTKSINGDYGTLTGNAYWKYNNYVGNKADAGAEITLYSLDTIRGNLKFEATADVQGNYKIEKILPGSYLLIVRSENATDCPDRHLSKLRIYGNEIKQLFDFDIEKYKTQLDEINVLDSLASVSLNDKNPSKALDGYYKYSEQSRNKANELLKSFPNDFKWKINLYTGYSNAYDFSIIRIEEDKTENIITDFGITCI